MTNRPDDISQKEIKETKYILIISYERMPTLVADMGFEPFPSFIT